MNLNKTYLFGLLVLPASIVSAQDTIPSIKQLKEVEIHSSRHYNFTSGNKIEKLDSNLLNRYSTNNLADLLSNESQVFVKSYGQGSLATTSFRGAGANHTAVLWNNFNIEGPMSGMVDLSLIPVNFINDVTLQYGAAGALWGTGAVGGSILLNNSSTYNKGISIQTNTSFGSFSDKQQQASIEFSKRKFASSLKVFNHEAKNDFLYSNIAKYGPPLEKQSNAELKQYGFLQENYFQINSKQQINTRFWYQFNDRNISPSMTQNISVSNQKDESIRLTSEWQRKAEKVVLFLRAAYFDEYLRFADSLIQIDSRSKTKTSIVEAEGRLHFTKYDLLNLGWNNTYREADSKEFSNTPHENRTSVFASYTIHTLTNSWNAVLSVRQELIKGRHLPFTLSLGAEGKILKHFYIKANIAQHFRLPTFNDLYYHGQGGKGNPDLKPESGWCEEAGIVHKYKFKKTEWELGATVFNRNIDNWIVWIPVTPMIWAPSNVRNVWSRGVEYKLKLNYSIKKLTIQFSSMYNYIRSTVEKSAQANDASVGKFLMYVPIQNAQGSVLIAYKGTSFAYVQTYTGYRFTTSDNTGYLKPYTIGNVNFSQTFVLTDIRIKLFVQLNNIWNEKYQILAYQAMPMMNYQLGLALYFNQPNINLKK